MNTYDGPGRGWRDVTDDPHQIKPDDDHMTVRIAGKTTHWLYEEPVPPLPTEPYTVIRIYAPSIAERGRVMLLLPMADMNLWVTTEGHHYGMADITRFEVLAEPKRTLKVAETAVEYPVDVEQARRETVDAVLGRVAEENALRSEQIDRIAEEFGLSS